jgi:S-adenosylmethionine uptake transporter
VGILATIGHVLVTKAFQYADASLLAGFQYTELISAAILGWWIFGDVPSLNTWIGSAILVGSGLYIFHRERQAAAQH